MNIFVNGCSFSHGHTDFGENHSAPSWVWPSLLHNRGYGNVINLAHIGSSNARIFRTSMEYLLTVDNPNDWLVLIQTSAWNRTEFYSDKHKKWVGTLSAGQFVVYDWSWHEHGTPAKDEFDLERKIITQHSAIIKDKISLMLENMYQIAFFKNFCESRGFKNVYFLPMASNCSLEMHLNPSQELQNFPSHSAGVIDYPKLNHLQKLWTILGIEDNYLTPISHIVRGLEEPNDGHPNIQGHAEYFKYIINTLNLRKINE